MLHQLIPQQDINRIIEMHIPIIKSDNTMVWKFSQYGVTCSQIDFFLIQKSNIYICLDYIVITRGILTRGIRLRRRAKRRSHNGAQRIKCRIWRVKNIRFSNTRF
jgi:hypothetical protein